LVSGSSGGGAGVSGRPTATGGEPLRPPHVIRPDEVAAWLADSVNTQLTYHRTLRADAQDILEHGVDVTRSRIGAYGQGFYTATDPAVFPGEAVVTLAIRARRPLVGDEPDIADQTDALARRFGRTGRITLAVAAAIRQELLGLGHDAIIVRNAVGEGVDYVIALDSVAVKVVVEP